MLNEIKVGAKLLRLQIRNSEVIRIPCILSRIELLPSEVNFPAINVKLHVIDEDGTEHSHFDNWFEVPYPG